MLLEIPSLNHSLEVWHILYAGKKSYWTNGEIHKKRGECPDSKAQRSQKRAAKGRNQKNVF